MFKNGGMWDTTGECFERCVWLATKFKTFFSFFPYNSNRGQNEPIVVLDKNTIFYTLLFQKPPAEIKMMHSTLQGKVRVLYQTELQRAFQ